MLQIEMPEHRAGASLAVTNGELRSCSHCGKILQAAEFYRQRNSYSSRCKKCHGLTIKLCRVCGLSFEGKVNQILCSPECKRAHRPQTFKTCAYCGNLFGPVSHLKTRFCSRKCKHAGQKKLNKKPPVQATSLARAAQTRVARAIKAGILNRPESCSQCGRDGRIEAAHTDYKAALDIRWLCKSCHAKWDWAQPKGGTVSTAARLGLSSG